MSPSMGLMLESTSERPCRRGGPHFDSPDKDPEVRLAALAAAELQGLFELFQDDDVLQLFDMSEPADAAVAGHSPISDQLGVVDQRLEAWFEPFGGTAPTGYLADRL